jgi:hypothetical protein
MLLGYIKGKHKGEVVCHHSKDILELSRLLSEDTHTHYIIMRRLGNTKSNPITLSQIMGLA